jgi:probable HAF family extracellular repeat protein
MKRLAVPVATALMLFAAVSADAQSSTSGVRIESVTELPTLGGHNAHANAISELGHVVGASATPEGISHAFLWTRENGIVDLVPSGGSSEAHDVNDRGEAVGWFENADGLARPFVWSRERGLVELPLLGEQSGAAIAINNAGHVLGVIVEDAVIWTANGRVIRLPTIANDLISAESMNEFSEVTGRSRQGVFRWSPRTGVMLPGLEGGAVDINDRADVVGNATFSGDAIEPFLWTRADVRQLLPEPPPGNEGAVTGVNNLRHVVGFMELPEGHPTGWLGMIFLWTPAAGVIPLLSSVTIEETGIHTTADVTDQGAIAGEVDGVGAVVWQLETSASQITAAMRVRISETANRGLLQRGHARALLARLDQVDRDLRRRKSAASHARSLRDQVFKLTRTGAFAETQGPPMRRLANVLVEKTRRAN